MVVTTSGHRERASGGPRTYVIGLNIGPAGDGNSEADLLGKIANDTGGYYFPLLRSPGDSSQTQSKRIQPVFNAIDALLQCHGAPQQTVRTLAKSNIPAAPATSQFAGAAGLEVVLSWTAPNTQVAVASATVRNAGGRVIANLSGKRPRRHGRHHRQRGPRPAKLVPGLVQGSTFQTITVARPKHGASLAIAVAASELSEATAVSIRSPHCRACRRVRQAPPARRLRPAADRRPEPDRRPAAGVLPRRRHPRTTSSRRRRTTRSTRSPITTTPRGWGRRLPPVSGWKSLVAFMTRRSPASTPTATGTGSPVRLGTTPTTHRQHLHERRPLWGPLHPQHRLLGAGLLRSTRGRLRFPSN